MKQLMYLLVTLILLAFAVPAIASDNFNKGDPGITAAMIDMDSAPVVAVTTKIENNTFDQEASMNAPCLVLAVITHTEAIIDQRARHVANYMIFMATTEWPDAMRPNGDGGILLRQFC